MTFFLSVYMMISSTFHICLVDNLCQDQSRKCLSHLMSGHSVRKIIVLSSKSPCVLTHFFYVFCIEVTLDYKALLLLLNKKDDEDFVLGGKGYDVECCAFCDAIRVKLILSILTVISVVQY